MDHEIQLVDSMKSDNWIQETPVEAAPNRFDSETRQRRHFPRKTRLALRFLTEAHSRLGRDT